MFIEKKYSKTFFILIILQLFNVKNCNKEYSIELHFSFYNLYTPISIFFLENNQPFPKLYLNGTEKTSEIINHNNKYCLDGNLFNLNTNYVLIMLLN